MVANPHPSLSAAFRLHGVGKQFGSAWACRNIDLEVVAGEVLAIAGENGAGKSTLMKCLCGMIEPTAGYIEAQGERAAFKTPADAEAVGISMIPQETDLFPELSVCENLFVGTPRPRNRLGLFDGRQMHARAAQLLGRLGLSIDVTQPVKRFSAATAKLFEIARSLNRACRLLILDEPTAALTKIDTQNLFGVIRYLKARGVAIVYITHRLEEIFELSDRIVVMRDGSIVSSGKVGEFEMQSLITQMVGRSVEALYTRSSFYAGDTALAVRGLERRGVFHEINITLKAGEVLGFAGLIGAGRSEVAQALWGIRPAERGEITVSGRSVRINSVSAAIAAGIAYLPEERRSQGLVLPFTVSQNITLSALRRYCRWGIIDRSRERVIAQGKARELSIVGGEVDDRVESLSGGNQQKVLLAKLLTLDPDILILDEPTRGVDIGAKADIYALIEALAGQGKAILLISSDMNELLALSDRVAVMFEGRLIDTLDRDECSVERIGAAILGQRMAAQV